MKFMSGITMSPEEAENLSGFGKFLVSQVIFYNLEETILWSMCRKLFSYKKLSAGAPGVHVVFAILALVSLK